MPTTLASTSSVLETTTPFKSVLETIDPTLKKALNQSKEFANKISSLENNSSIGLFFEENLNLIHYILAIPGQDLEGCLVNCSNNGKCSYKNEKFKCICNENFFGPMCEFFSNKMICQLSKPCRNNGKKYF